MGLIRSGASLQEVREFMRHDHTQTTEGYVDWEQMEKANAQDRLNYRLPSARATDAGDHQSGLATTAADANNDARASEAA